jgi:hypothetical protein
VYVDRAWVADIAFGKFRNVGGNTLTRRAY